MLAYHAAAIDRQVAGVIGMTFLDQREQLVRDATALNLFMSRVGVRWRPPSPQPPSASSNYRSPSGGYVAQLVYPLPFYG